jgi:hypothetical protein
MRRGKRPNKPTKDDAIAAGWRMVLSAINDSMVIAAAALHDEYGFGEKRTKRFLDKFSELFETCIQEGDMLDVGSIEKVLQEEGIKCIGYHKYDFMRVEKDV